MSILLDLAAESRLGKGHWAILVYLWQIHLRGDDCSNLRALGLGDGPLRHHVEHLAFRGLVHEHADGGRWMLSPQGRQAFGLDASTTAANQPGKPDGRHAFLQRDRETQRLALAAWYNSGAARGQLTQVHEHWKDKRLDLLPPHMLEICERWVLKLASPGA